MSNNWMPFNAVCDGMLLADAIERKKRYIRKPLLSDDQLELLQEKIIESYSTNSTIKIKYYLDGYYYYMNEKIKKIDINNRKLFFNDGKYLYLNQIIDVF